MPVSDHVIYIHFPTSEIELTQDVLLVARQGAEVLRMKLQRPLSFL